MQITPANLSFFFNTLETRFWMAYQTEAPWINKIATTYPVDSDLWVSGWMGMIDRAREWLGSRIVRTPAPETYMVPIQLFELTESIDELKLKDDKYGIYFPLISFMGQQMTKFPDYELRDLIQNRGSQTGVRQKGTDLLTHWHVAHPVDIYDASKGTFSNDFTNGGLTINGITVGGGFSTNGFNTLWQEFASRKSQSGEALGIEPDLSMFPTQLKAAATTILQSQMFAPPVMGPLGTGSTSLDVANAPFVGSMDNPLKGWTDLFINKDLQGDPTTWYMMFTKGPLMPFSWLLREAPDFVSRIRPDDPVVFDTHTYLYGSKSRGAPAWGLPWLSARSGPAT